MIEALALVSGKLHGQPTQKIARTGNPYVTARVRAYASDSNVFINVIAFSPAACQALLAGSLTPKAWTDKEGTARPALDLVASQILSAHHVTRKRKALERRPRKLHLPPDAQPLTRHDEFNDGGPLDF